MRSVRIQSGSYRESYSDDGSLQMLAWRPYVTSNQAGAPNLGQYHFATEDIVFCDKETPAQTAKRRLKGIVSLDRDKARAYRWRIVVDWARMTGMTPLGRIIKPHGARNIWKWAHRT